MKYALTALTGFIVCFFEYNLQNFRFSMKLETGQNVQRKTCLLMFHGQSYDKNWS